MESTIDVSASGGVNSAFLPGNYHKDAGAVGVDLIFGYLKFTGETVGEDLHANPSSINAMNGLFDQFQKTISDEKK